MCKQIYHAKLWGIVWLLVVTGISVSTAVAAGGNEIFKSIYEGDLTKVKARLSAQADVNAKRDDGTRALMLASTTKKKPLAVVKAPPNDAKTGSIPLSAQIHDSVLVKLIALDLGMNALSLGWEDRENTPFSRGKLEDLLALLLKKYGRSAYVDDNTFSWGNTLIHGNTSAALPKLWSGKKDFPADVGIEATVNTRSYFSIRIPDDRYYELYSTAEVLALPVIKYRAGPLRLLLNSMTVEFKEGAKCMVGNAEYIRVGQDWLPKPP